MGSPLRHILEAQQFDRSLLEHFFATADRLRTEVEKDDYCKLRKTAQALAGRIILPLFYEPSTRTRTSFVLAGQRLGMRVCWTENAREFSSAIKGESIEDTVRVLGEYYPDIIVIRHPETGAVARAAAVSRVPIINAGDGQGQHPTQALLDIYTIKQSYGQIDGLTVAMMGDLAHGRTVRSLSYLLTKFEKVRLIFVSPPDLAMRDDLKTWLTSKGINFSETDRPFPALSDADVVYCTRIQKERGGEMSDDDIRRFRIGPEELAKLKRKSIIMHPLPRNDEIDPAIDNDPRAVYFKQAGNGMFIRMALLLWVRRRRL